MTPPVTTGRIVWAEIADANGVRKLRPAVVVTPPDRITPAGPFDVVAVTSRLSDPLPGDHVLLPWHPRGHPRTGLNRRCAAVCTWVARLVAGLVPNPVMVTILSKVAAGAPPPTAPPTGPGGSPTGGS